MNISACVCMNVYLCVYPSVDTCLLTCKCIYRCTFLQISPVQPCQEAFGCSDQVDHGGKKVVGQLARGSAVVVAAAPPARDEVLQVLGRRIELMRKSLQILSLQPVILEERGK